MSQLIPTITRALLKKAEVNYIVVITGRGEESPYKVDNEKTLAEPNVNLLVSWNGSRYDYSSGGIAI